eukprot:18597-Heterococcus_DN1.PRE.1
MYTERTLSALSSSAWSLQHRIIVCNVQQAAQSYIHAVSVHAIERANSSFVYTLNRHTDFIAI